MALSYYIVIKERILCSKIIIYLTINIRYRILKFKLYISYGTYQTVIIDNTFK